MTVTAMAVLPPELVPDGAIDQARDYLAGLGAHGLTPRFALADARP
jgi:hypothetical protein